MLCVFLSENGPTETNGPGLNVPQVFEFIHFVGPSGTPVASNDILPDGNIGGAEILVLIVVTNTTDTTRYLTVGHRGGMDMTLVSSPWADDYDHRHFCRTAMLNALKTRVEVTDDGLTFWPRLSPYNLSDTSVSLFPLDPNAIDFPSSTPCDAGDLNIAGGWLPYSTHLLQVPPGPDKTFLAAVAMSLRGPNYVNLVPGSVYFSIDGSATVLSTVELWDICHPHFNRPGWREDFNKLKLKVATPDQYDVAISTEALGGLATVQQSSNIYVQRDMRSDVSVAPDFDYFLTTSDGFCLQVGFVKPHSRTEAVQFARTPVAV